MSQAVCKIIYYRILNGPIDQVKIILHQKTLSKEIKNLFRDKLSDLPSIIRNVLLGHRQMDSMKIDRFLANLNFQTDSINIQLADEDSVPALWRAHYLALLSRRELLGKNRVSLFKALENKGYKDFENDVTQFFVKPPDSEIIEKWKRDTGLPEPHI